jgi:hypothetical protein
MSKSKRVGLILIWFLCGYWASAMWTGDFSAEFPTIVTLGSASRSSLYAFVLGPIGAFGCFMTCNHKPIWDWPRHLLEYQQ